MAVDSNDRVHISYTGHGFLMYAKNASGDWIVNTIERIEGMGKSTSIAIDSLDNVHISYLSYDSLKYATNASGSWVTYMIDKASGADYHGYWTSIALDTSDKAHISYYSDSGCLKYATNQ